MTSLVGTSIKTHRLSAYPVSLNVPNLTLFYLSLKLHFPCLTVSRRSWERMVPEGKSYQERQRQKKGLNFLAFSICSVISPIQKGRTLSLVLFLFLHLFTNSLTQKWLKQCTIVQIPLSFTPEDSDVFFTPISYNKALIIKPLPARKPRWFKNIFKSWTLKKHTSGDGEKFTAL